MAKRDRKAATILNLTNATSERLEDKQTEFGI